MRIESSVEFLHKVLSVLVTHASVDTYRPHMNCVAFGLTADGFVSALATDGHRLAHWLCDGIDGSAKKSDPRLLVSVADVKRIIVALKPYLKTTGARASIAGVAGRFSIRLTPDKPGTTSVSLSIEKRIGIDSVPFHQVFPKLPGMLGGARNTMTVNPTNLADAATAFAKASGNKNRAVVAFMNTNDALSPVVLRSSSVPGLTIIIMPCREEGFAGDWADFVPAWQPMKAEPPAAAPTPAVAAE